MRRKVVKWALALLLVIGGGVVVAGLWTTWQLRGSLPQLDGEVAMARLGAPVTVARDALGIPTVRGGSRADVARATGFLHAQDRFFQMDLSRRRAAGELSALVGPRALTLDRQLRTHRFRAAARDGLARIPAPDRQVLDAYVEGVNAGLQALGTRPFEYVVLRQTPAPWRAEDSLLVLLSMFVELHDTRGLYESAVGTMYEVLPQEVAAFVNSPGTEWDTPVVGAAFAVPPVPSAAAYNLRERRRGKPPIDLDERRRQLQLASAALAPADLAALSSPDLSAVGSNNFAVAGSHTANGGALIANDMHLAIRVPNVWYRMSLEWPGDQTGERARLIGLTLPGLPSMVVGSNTHVAWGFTNTYGDWSDLVLLELDESNRNRYRTRNGWRDFDHHEEVIDIAGRPPHRETFLWTIWGPVIDIDYRGRPRAYRWVAHSFGDQLSRGILPFERARTVDEVVAEANGLATPGQNIVIADSRGRIGWSVYGSIPRRIGGAGRQPTYWADGLIGWEGWLAPAEYPRIVDPPGGRIWTANARVVDGDMLAALGDGGYDVGARARIIRDALNAREQVTPRDMLAVQLNTQATFLARWRELLLAALTPAAIAGRPERAELRDVLSNDWTGEASPDSAAYGLTRAFRDTTSDRVIGFLLAECYDVDPRFDHRQIRRREGLIWKLLNDRPMHLLDPQHESWDALILAAADEVIASVGAGALASYAWADRTVDVYRHPLSSAIPSSSRWLDMPVRRVGGDLFTPRMQWRSDAASERFVISPGREAEGIMHMPVGQSGHPLSPFYANSHAAWLDGAPTPFLPGPAQHTLTLTPQK
jgi:penicillin G amidase